MEFYAKKDVIEFLKMYAELSKMLALRADIRGDKTEKENMIQSAATIMAINDRIEAELEIINI